MATLHKPLSVILRVWSAAEDILRNRPSGEAPAHVHWKRALLLIILFGSCYGALMGTFGGIAGERLLQVLYSALKVPLLLVFTFVVALPSFFVLNTLLGVRSDFSAVLTALISTQAGLTVLLLSFAPDTLFWYASFSDYDAAILFNAFVFGVAAVAGQWLLRRAYQPLIAKNPRHRVLLRTWLIIYAFVGIQSAWVLRPFIGSPEMTVQFFRQEAWGNAYVEIAQKARGLLSRK